MMPRARIKSKQTSKARQKTSAKNKDDAGAKIDKFKP
jgi:hypothetical protein